MKTMLDGCLEKVEASQGEMQSEEVHEEVPKEEAAVKSFGALMKQHRGQHLAAECGQKPKKGTRGNGGSRMKLASACRGLIHHAGVAQCKGHCRQGHIMNSVAPRIRNRDFKEQLHLGSKRTSGRIYRKALVLEIVK
jgi:hypothetical protein